MKNKTKNIWIYLYALSIASILVLSVFMATVSSYLLINDNYLAYEMSSLNITFCLALSSLSVISSTLHIKHRSLSLQIYSSCMAIFIGLVFSISYPSFSIFVAVGLISLLTIGRVNYSNQSVKSKSKSKEVTL